MNIPNTLSLLRIIVALSVPFFLIGGSFKMRIAAGIICFMAVLTDWFDGWYARKFNAVTKIGKILDPLADKTFVIVVFSVLAYLEVLSFWWVIPIILREVVITAYRFVFLARNIVVAAVKSGKIKTAMQMLTIGIAYLLFMLSKDYPELMYNAYWTILYIALSITVILTVHSGYVFFRNNWRLVKRIHNLT